MIGSVAIGEFAFPIVALRLTKGRLDITASGPPPVGQNVPLRSQQYTIYGDDGVEASFGWLPDDLKDSIVFSEEDTFTITIHTSVMTKSSAPS